MSSDDFKASADKAADKTVSSLHEGQDSLQAAGATKRVKALSDQVSGTAGDLYNQAADQVRGMSDALPGSASDAYRAGQRAYAQSSQTVARHVAKQPVEALLLAGAIGYLVGWATSRG